MCAYYLQEMQINYVGQIKCSTAHLEQADRRCMT